MSPLLTVDDLCERWGCCSPRTLERYRAQGLVGVRVGKGIMYRLDDVLRFEDSRATRKVKRRRRQQEDPTEFPVLKHL